MPIEQFQGATTRYEDTICIWSSAGAYNYFVSENFFIFITCLPLMHRTGICLVQCHVMGRTSSARTFLRLREPPSEKISRVMNPSQRAVGFPYNLATQQCHTTTSWMAVDLDDVIKHCGPAQWLIVAAQSAQCRRRNGIIMRSVKRDTCLCQNGHLKIFRACQPNSEC